jgi:hypothetical protein
MDIRFYVDPETGSPHIYGHAVDEDGDDIGTSYLSDSAGLLCCWGHCLTVHSLTRPSFTARIVS